MSKLGCIMVLLVCCATSNLVAQFTYFNQIEGFGAENSENGTNLEVNEFGFTIWGAKIVDGIEQKLIRSYDNEGNIVEQNLFTIENAFIYSGAANSFKAISNESNFLFSQGIADSQGLHGLIYKIGSDLDTIWTRVYDEFAPETYFYTHAPSDSGFILAGEYGPNPGERGTFIMEIDSVGNVLWHNEIHAPNEGLFRNVNISQYGNKYLVSGTDQANNNGEGYIEIISDSGILLNHLEAPPGGMARGFMLHIINNEDEVIVCHPRSEDESGLLSLTYNSLFLSKLDVEIESLTTQNQLFEGQNWLAGAPIKIIQISDGYVVAGRYRQTAPPHYNRKAWIMKIDDDFQQEWYTELSYDDAPGNAHYPYDMEQTSDGGYVVVGAYRNSADFYDRTWLVKVDACGDLEWQGCEPVGIQEWEIQSRNDGMKLEIYPNPYPAGSSAPLGVRFPQEVQLVTLVLVDVQGRVHYLSLDGLKLNSNPQSEYKLIPQTFPPGLYTIIATTKAGKIYSSKLVVE